MKYEDVVVGRMYYNRKKGTTLRKVLAIKKGLDLPWYSPSPRPDEPVVEYEQNGKIGRLYIRSFAAWAGGWVST
jgi:hypothetical protein